MMNLELLFCTCKASGDSLFYNVAVNHVRISETGGFTTKLFWDYNDFTRDYEVIEKHTYPAI